MSGLFPCALKPCNFHATKIIKTVKLSQKQPAFETDTPIRSRAADHSLARPQFIVESPGRIDGLADTKRICGIIQAGEKTKPIREGKYIWLAMIMKKKLPDLMIWQLSSTGVSTLVWHDQMPIYNGKGEDCGYGYGPAM